MNLITSEKAYCLFPIATLEKSTTLVIQKMSRTKHALLKYKSRGYRLLSNVWSDKDAADYGIGASRSMEDKQSLVINLDMHGILSRKPLSHQSNPLPWDTSVPNTWRMIERDGGVQLKFRLIKHKILKYRYFTAHIEHGDMVDQFLIEQDWVESVMRQEAVTKGIHREHIWWGIIYQSLLHSTEDSQQVG